MGKDVISVSVCMDTKEAEESIVSMTQAIKALGVFTTTIGVSIVRLFSCVAGTGQVGLTIVAVTALVAIVVKNWNTVSVKVQRLPHQCALLFAMTVKVGVCRTSLRTGSQ